MDATHTVEPATILLVEDEDAVRSVARRALERKGFLVIEAASGDEAIRLADRDDVRIDLLLSDVLMPGTSGCDLAEHLRKRHSGLRVLLMSGYDESVIAAQAAPVPGAEFLEKPFTPSDLVSKVRHALRRAA